MSLTPAERGELTRNAAVMVFVTRQVPDTRLRACIYAMLVNGNVGQFTAMDRFLDACLDAWVVLSAGTEQPPTATPDFLRTALRSVAYECRLALYRLVEDARRQFVDALPAPINRRVLHALREGGDPQ